jgi:hypothetical protein
MYAKTLAAAVGLTIAFAVMTHQNAAAGASFASVCAWNDLDWSDMTNAQQALWARLGWNHARWDGNRPPASNTQDWSRLTADERNAAAELGFGPRSWETACSSSGSASKGTLSAEERERALENALGFAQGG